MMQKIGRYQIKEEIARGGMAIVFHAFDPSFERDVAIKLLPRQFLYHDIAARARFQQEVKTIAALEHNAIVPVYDVGIHDEQPFLVMRLMTGGSLADKIKEGLLSHAETLVIFERIGSALDEAHAKGIVHRDLKPNNILFDQRGDAYLSDFGIAKLSETGAGLTETSILVGTPAYMSPEQALGEANVDGRSDVYALGVILYEMLTGKMPYTAETPMGIAMKHVMEPVPTLAGNNNSLLPFNPVIQRALAKDKNDRYPDVADMTSCLAAATRGEVVENPPIISSSPPPKKFRWGWIIAGIFLLTLIIGGWQWNNIRAVFKAEPTATTAAIANVTATATPTNQPTAQPTPSPTKTNTAIPTPTNTETPTITPSPSSTPMPTFTASPTIPAIESIQPIIVSVCPRFSQVRIRREPSDDARVLGLLSEGSCVPVLGKNNNGSWYNVQLADGVVGWVSAQVVAIAPGMNANQITLAITVPATPAPPTTSTPSGATLSTSIAPLTPSPTVPPTPDSSLITWIANVSPPEGSEFTTTPTFEVEIGYSLQTNPSNTPRFYTSIRVEGHQSPNCEGQRMFDYSNVDRTDVETNNGRKRIIIVPDRFNPMAQSVRLILRVTQDDSPQPTADSPNFLVACYAVNVVDG